MYSSLIVYSHRCSGELSSESSVGFAYKSLNTRVTNEKYHFFIDLGLKMDSSLMREPKPPSKSTTFIIIALNYHNLIRNEGCWNSCSEPAWLLTRLSVYIVTQKSKKAQSSLLCILFLKSHKVISQKHDVIIFIYKKTLGFINLRFYFI